MFKARFNEAIDHGCNWNDVLYSELETVVHREASSAVAIYYFGPQKTHFISGLIKRTVIDITQLGCPPLKSYVYRPSAARLHVTTSLNMFVHCERPIH